MMRMLALLACVLLAAPSYAGSFVNGDFETGDWSGWARGSGTWRTSDWPLDPSAYLPGGAKNAGGDPGSYWYGAITSPGPDPIVGAALNQTFGGAHSARINNSSPTYHVGVISQTVANYTDPFIYFAWAAVLQESHGATDSDNFSLKLTNDTRNLTLYSVSYSSFSAPGTFIESGSWYYSPWKALSLDVSSYAGDTFTLTLLAADCARGAHAGYVYLDGFGAAIPEPTDGPVPEPGTLLLLGTGLVGLLRSRRRKG